MEIGQNTKHEDINRSWEKDRTLTQNLTTLVNTHKMKCLTLIAIEDMQIKIDPFQVSETAGIIKSSGNNDSFV